MVRRGRHFLQIPGPTNVPDRILRAMDFPTIDHRGPDFQALGREVLEGCRAVFQTAGHVVIFPSSGTGAWEAAIVNTLSPGDRVLMVETGYFASLWRAMAQRLGLEVEFIGGDWRHGVNPKEVEQRLSDDRARSLRAVMVVHNETSTGVTSRIHEVRRAIDRVGHPALLMVDTISSLASIDYRHDEWGVDVTVGGSQKGLMLPPGLGFNAVSDKALAASRSARMQRSYWDWQEMLKSNATGFFPYTPATNLLYGLRESLRMLQDEGLPAVFARHSRHAEAARAAVRGWGLELLPLDAAEYSSSLTAVLMPQGHDSDRFRAAALEGWDISLGAGLGKLQGKIFRIGHLGDFNDLMLMGTLAGVELGLRAASVPFQALGLSAAIDVLSRPQDAANASRRVASA
jgi:alanine-glyoxylate transaminase/serine-glyoxylate transaminase/serine-pyruvate transaminase